MKKVLTLLLIIFFVVACSKKSDDRTFPELKGKNVVLLVIDTLRADHLSIYGYSKETDPFLKSIAEKSVVFENHISTCSSTAPATASILTGLFPSQHGVISNLNVYSHLAKTKKYNNITINRLPEDAVTIAKLFKQAGYKTFGLTDNHNASATLGFDIGFDKFHTLHYEGVEAMNRYLASWEKEIKGAGKYFLYLHYMDPHEPYHPRSPWYKEGANRKENMVNAYDSEINYLDYHIEETFKRFNILDDAVLIITSDHGEEFYEHGNKGHGHNLYTETNHVPLIIHFPGIKPGRVFERTSHVDIVPTLVELSSLNSDAAWNGISLTARLKGQALPKRAIFSELLKLPENPRPPRRSVYVDQMHLIETMKDEWSYQLFDVVKDYYEKYDLYPNQKDIAQTMKDKFETLDNGKKDTSEQTVTVEVSDETINQLKTLGYVN